MSRETSDYIVGDYWLDKRRDGLSPHIWQVATYKARTIIYRSTKCRDLEDAKAFIHAYVEQQRAREAQPADEALVLPQLALYIEERAEGIINDAQSRSSLRAFIGFLDQDRVTASATFAELDPDIWERFRLWRMKPHSYAVQGKDKLHEHSSQGVVGETVQRNLDDIRAALNYAAARRRVPFAPKVPNLDRKYRSRPRDVRLTLKTLGAILAYAKQDDDAAYRWIALMIGTAVRPDAALAFHPEYQDHGNLLDMHPTGWPRTKKVNPWVPTIAPLRPILDDWKTAPHAIADSRKRWWRTMREMLNLADNIVPKTIRHTIATELRARGVPGAEVSGILGHHDPEMERTSGVYAKYDPKRLAKAKATLTKIFAEVAKHAEAWSADHLLTKEHRGRKRSIDTKAKKSQDITA